MQNPAHTAHNKKRFLEALASCRGIIGMACQMANVGRSTVLMWRKDDPEFNQAVLEAMDSQIDMVESQLFDNIKNGCTTSTIFYLKTKGKNRGYGETATGEITIRFEDEP